MRVPPSRLTRACATIALAGLAVTCRDDPTGLGGRHTALAVVPVMPADLNLAAFNISVDSVRVHVIRRPSDTLTTVAAAFPPDSSALRLSLNVQLVAASESLVVALEFRGAGFLLFAGADTVEVTSGTSNPPVSIPLTFVGPGASVDSLVVQPLDSAITWGDSLRFRVLAFQGGAPVTSFYVSWTSSDTLVARVNAHGVVRAPARRDTVFVRATTPSGATDSVRTAFYPIPNALPAVSGLNQTGLPGTVLPVPLRVQARAADGLGVPQTAVRFRSTLGGGSVADSVVVTDDSGFAQTAATLGSAFGANQYTATVGSVVTTFSAAATAGTAVRLEFTTQPGPTAAAGQPITPAVVVTARDAAGNVATSFSTQVLISLLDNPGGAILNGTFGVAAVNGVATFNNLRLNIPSTGYTLLATATGMPSIASDTSAAFGIVTGAPFRLRVVGGQDQAGGVGAPLFAQLGVEVTDSVGNPVVGFAGVLWATPDGGTVVPGAPTDTNGITLATWTLGPGLGTQTATATFAGLTLPPASFTALGVPAGTTRTWRGFVDTNYNDAANWSPGSVPGLSDSVFVPASVANQPVLTAIAATVARLTVETGASLDIGAFGYTVVRDVEAFGPITGTGFVTLTGVGAVRGTLPSLSVNGVRAVTGPLTLTGDLAVTLSGELSVGGHTIIVPGALTVEGNLLMQNAADTVIVNGLATFRSDQGGAGEMTAGVLRLRGQMLQQSAIGPFFNTFAPSGTHKTVLDGTALQNIGFTNPGPSFFHDVEFANAAGVTFTNGAAINALATISAGTVTNVTGPVSVGQLADALGGRWQIPFTTVIGPTVSLPDSLVTTLTFSGPHTLAKGFGLVGDVFIPTGASVTVGGRRVTMTGALTVQGHLRMISPADTVRVGGSATFQAENGSAGDYTAGVLFLGGAFTQSTASGPFGNTFAPTGTHKTVFDGPSIQSVSFADPGQSFFQDVEFSNPFDVVLFSNAVIGGQAAVSAGRASGSVTVSVGQLADTVGGRWQVANTAVTGTAPSLPDSLVSNLTFDGPQTLAKGFATQGDVTLLATSTLTVGGHRMFLSGNLDVQGHLRMQDPADTVIVRSNALFQSAGGAAGDMTDGVLTLMGSFTQLPASGPFFNTFAPSGNHTTVFAAATGTTISFADPGSSFFHHLELRGAGLISLASAIPATGQLRSPSGPVTPVVGAFPITAAGLDVDGLSLDGPTLVSTNGTLARFDNVTFQNTDPGDTAVAISHPGAATPFQLTNVTFGVTPTTGAYIAATDNTADANVLTINMVGAVASNGPGFTFTAGGAVVNWALVQFGAIVPASPTAGLAFTTQVEVRDGAGVVDTLYNDTITVALGANPGGSALSGTLLKVANRGLANFDDLSLDKIGAGYTLQATARNVGTVSSAAFTVVAGAISAATSTVAVSDSTVGVGLNVGLSLQARDSLGNLISTGGATVAFTQSGGTSVGLVAPSPAADSGNGTYHATFTGVTLGTPVTIGATVNGNAVTTTLPTLRVFVTQTVHSADITTDETWTAAASPHIVTAYLRVRNGATLTIEPGAEVRFDADAGLQVGDTTSSEVGTLLMDGTAAPITLTANTGSPTPGFWKGIELQRAGAATWHRVLFEWGGSPRAPMAPQPESCLLSVNTQGAAVTLDSVRFRQCVHAGIHHFGGTLVITRSVFDSATGSGIHADFQAVLSVDSSLFRGSANDGLQILNPGVKLVSATGNTFLGQGAFAVSLFGTQLHGLHRQAAIAGNGNDSIYVEAGRVDTSVAAFTIEAQPVPYLVDGLVQVGRAGAGGATVTLDSGLVMAFTSLGGLQVGDTSGTQRGQIRTRSTAANPALLRNQLGGGFWRGLGLGLAAAPDTLRHVRVVRGGGSGGAFGIGMANITIYRPSGTDPFFLDSVAVDSSNFDGIHVAHAPLTTPRSRVVRSTLTGNALNGLVILTTGTAPAVLDSLNAFAGNIDRPIVLSGHALGGHTAQAAFDTTGLGLHEILVTSGQTYTVNMRPPAQLPYVTSDSALLVQGGNGTFTLEPNLVLKFGRASGLVIGDSVSGPAGSIASLGTGPADAPRLTSNQPTPVPGDWYGLEIGRLSANTRLANVRIEYAGDSIAGRYPHRFGLLTRNAQLLSLTIDSVIVAYSGKIGGGADTNSAGYLVSGAGAGVSIRRSLADTNPGYGFITFQPARFIDDTARGNQVGFSAFRLFQGTTFTSLDSMAGNVATAGNQYPLRIDTRAVPMLYGNSFTGNLRDTLLLEGGEIPWADTLPKYPGTPWRVLNGLFIDSLGVLTLSPGDTLVFDDSTSIFVGGSVAGGFQAVSSSAAPILLTANPGGANRWFGIVFTDPSAGPDTLLRNVIIERAGRLIPCFGDCNPTPVAAIQFFDQTSTRPYVFDSITVRHSVVRAIHAEHGANGASLTIDHSQFYNNGFATMIQGPASPGRGFLLQIHNSDIYAYRRQAVGGVFAGSPLDSIDATGNWWGDVDGAWPGFGFQDSLGRAFFNGNAVKYLTFATAPFFPGAAGPAAALIATDDTAFLFRPLLSSDSIRARAVDALGRGVNGATWSWTPGDGTTTVSPSSASADGGGRAVALWSYGTSAGPKQAFANAVGTVTYLADVQPDTTATVNFQLIPMPGGVVSAGGDSVTYTSSNYPSALVTNARDPFGNVTQPSSGFFFTDVPNNTGFQAYGVIDSVKSDTVFFRPGTAFPSNYQLHALYNGGPIEDSVLITVVPNPVAVRIDREPYLQGIQDTGLVAYPSVCPGGGPGNVYCQRQFQAVVVDSGGGTVGNGSAMFQWLTPSLPDSIITVDSLTGPTWQAWTHSTTNGVSWLVAVDTVPGSPTFNMRDSVPLIVQQQGSFIQFAPDTQSVLVGGTATFTAEMRDIAGVPMPNEVIHFAISSFDSAFLHITDTLVVNQVTVQLDSSPFGSTFVDGFWARPLADSIYGYFPNDTVFGFGEILSPVQTSIATSSFPTELTLNATANRLYVGHAGSGQMVRVDLSTDAVIDSTYIGPNIRAVAVNPGTDMVYVANDSIGGELAVVEGATGAVLTSLSFATGIDGLAIDPATDRVYAIGADPTNGVPKLFTVDGVSNTLIPQDTVALPAPPRSATFHPGNGFVYVTLITDTLAIIDPVALSIVTLVDLGSANQAERVAVNTATDRVYVTLKSAGQVAEIDGATHAVLSTLFTTFQPRGLTIDPVLGVLYVSGEGSSDIDVQDLTTQSSLGNIFLGFNAAPTAVIRHPATGRLYVTMSNLDAIKSLRF